MEVSQTTKEMLHVANDFAKAAPIKFILGGILSQLSAGLLNAAVFFQCIFGLLSQSYRMVQSAKQSVKCNDFWSLVRMRTSC